MIYPYHFEVTSVDMNSVFSHLDYTMSHSDFRDIKHNDNCYVAKIAAKCSKVVKETIQHFNANHNTFLMRNVIT